MSWEEQNKWFSLRKAGETKTVDLHPNPRAYTMNYPAPIAIPAGGSMTFKYNLSDNSQEGWAWPKGFEPGKWDFQIQAHFEIPREVVAHQYGVFMGKVTSPWYDAKGREIEPAGKPEPEAAEIAIESRKDFPWDRLKAALEKWDQGTPEGGKTLAGYFGVDFPWEQLQTHYDQANEGGILEILLPDNGVLTFQFGIDQPALTKLFKRKKGWIFPNDGWLDAKSVLAITAAKRVESIELERGRSRAETWFKRTFDSKGRIKAGE